MGGETRGVRGKRDGRRDKRSEGERRVGGETKGVRGEEGWEERQEE